LPVVQVVSVGGVGFVVYETTQVFGPTYLFLAARLKRFLALISAAHVPLLHRDDTEQVDEYEARIPCHRQTDEGQFLRAAEAPYLLIGRVHIEKVLLFRIFLTHYQRCFYHLGVVII
jgi:hypothetical protein